MNFKSIKTEDDYSDAMRRVEHLMELNPPDGSPEASELAALAAVIVTYEHILLKENDERIVLEQIRRCVVTSPISKPTAIKQWEEMGLVRRVAWCALLAVEKQNPVATQESTNTSLNIDEMIAKLTKEEARTVLSEAFTKLRKQRDDLKSAIERHVQDMDKLMNTPPDFSRGQRIAKMTTELQRLADGIK